MKKVMSLLLALCMVFSLCACAEEADMVLDTVKANNQAADNYHPELDATVDGTDEPTEPAVSTPVTQVTSSKWKVGKVDPSLLFTLEHMPLMDGDVCLKMEAESYGGIESEASFGFNLYFSDGVSTGFSMYGSYGEDAAETMYFEVDGQTYMFSSITNDGKTDAGVFKIVHGEDELEDEVFGMSDDIDPAEIIDVEGYQTTEYLGVEDSMDKFRVVDEDGEEMFFYLDVLTQRLVKMTYEVEEDGLTTALILYGDEAKLDYSSYDIEKAKEADSDAAGMAILAPMMILMSGVEITE